MEWYAISLVALAVIAVAAVVVLAVRSYTTASPNQILVATGGQRQLTDDDGGTRSVSYRVQVGGGMMVWPWQSSQTLPLDLLALPIKVVEALTAQGVAVTAVGQGLVRVRTDSRSLHLVVEQFLARGAEGIRDVASDVLEGCFRAQIGAHTVEQIFQRRDELAALVKQEAARDLDRMGLEVLAFALKDVSDSKGYIEALSAPRIAEVKRDAAIVEAETNKEASIKAAEARKDGDVARLAAEAEVARASADFELKRAGYQVSINRKRAEADAAYELERVQRSQALREAEYGVRLLEKDKAIELEQREIERRERELESTVRRPAEAHKFKQKLEAEADAYRKELDAKGKAAGIKLLGAAEAEAMSKRAESFAGYNQAALAQMLIDALPAVAKQVAEPLSRVEKIVMVDTGNGAGGPVRLAGQVTGIMAQLPEVVRALTGVDLTQVVAGRQASPPQPPDPAGKGA